jgi:hypothetical protein
MGGIPPPHFGACTYLIRLEETVLLAAGFHNEFYSSFFLSNYSTGLGSVEGRDNGS